MALPKQTVIVQYIREYTHTHCNSIISLGHLNVSLKSSYVSTYYILHQCIRYSTPSLTNLLHPHILQPGVSQSCYRVLFSITLLFIRLSRLYSVRILLLRRFWNFMSVAIKKPFPFAYKEALHRLQYVIMMFVFLLSLCNQIIS